MVERFFENLQRKELREALKRAPDPFSRKYREVAILRNPASEYSGNCQVLNISEGIEDAIAAGKVSNERRSRSRHRWIAGRLARRNMRR